jgi:DNA photolyase
MTTIVWLRQDLRTRDNPALAAAAARGRVLPVFILDDVTPGPQWRWGGASRWWLHHSLVALRDNLGDLPLFRGDPRELLPAIIKKVGAAAVYWSRCYASSAITRDTELKASLQRLGVEVQSFNGSLLHEPWDVATGSGGPFKVFTPYWRASCSRPVLRRRYLHQCSRSSSPRHSVIAWRIGASCPQIPTGPWAGNSSGHLAKTARSLGSMISPKTDWPDTKSFASGPICVGRHGFRRICIGSKFRPGKSGPAWLWNLKTHRNGIASKFLSRSAGESLLITSSIIFRRSPSATGGRISMLIHGATAPKISRHGDEDLPETRSLMPACVSYGRPAGCIIACG